MYFAKNRVTLFFLQIHDLLYKRPNCGTTVTTRDNPCITVKIENFSAYLFYNSYKKIKDNKIGEIRVHSQVSTGDIGPYPCGRCRRATKEEERDVEEKRSERERLKVCWRRRMKLGQNEM